MVSIRRQRVEARRARMERQMGAFAVLPQELILCVLTAVAASADKPADLFNAMLVCKQFYSLVSSRTEVIQAASAACVSVLPTLWCAAAERFLRFCGDRGNADANYFVGMVWFYCFGLQSQGWSRLMMAVRSGHAHAAFSVAVICYNGSYLDFDRDQRAAAHMFALAACRGHMGALRDLAFCVTNGFGGAAPDPAAGRRLTFATNLREFRARYRTRSEMAVAYAHVVSSPRCLTSELGCFTAVPASLQGWAHPANRFLREWFTTHPLPLPLARLPLMCSMPTCGRPEMQGLEFRRCHVCGVARYCSRTCQSLHWRTGHTRECVPVHQWLMETIANANQQPAVVDAAPMLPAVNNATDDQNNLGGGGGAAGASPDPPM